MFCLHLQVAIKIVYKKLISKELLARQHREVHIMKKLQHPHIVRLYEVFESDEALYLVLEYVPCGELYDYLISRGRMKEKEARTKFLQVMSALLYCHSRRIVHRDLKAENILVDAHLNLKVVGTRAETGKGARGNGRDRAKEKGPGDEARGFEGRGKGKGRRKGRGFSGT